jgi:hypothetical protein
MVDQITNAIFKPLQAVLTLEENPFEFAPLVVAVQRISLQAGAEIGTAVVEYPATYAQNATPAIGKRASIKIGETMVFRGAIAHAPFEIGPDRDEFQLILSCDKWLMARNVIGQAAIGSTVGGFIDVGYDLVFNKDGRPNRDPAEIEFSLGTGAVYWTLQDMLTFVFDNYIDTDVAIIPGGLTLPEEFLIAPSHVNLVGQTALQAVDTICKIASVSWGLVPAEDASGLCIVKPGTGTARVARFYKPKAGAGVSGVNTLHANAGRVEHSMVRTRDYIQAVSGNVVCEQTYSNIGLTCLLDLVPGFKDPKYVARFAVDVTQYAANELGQSLTAGSKPKPWLGSLVTRIKADGSAYLLAAEIAADPELRAAKRVDAPIVWMSADGDPLRARLVTGGMRVDSEHCTIDFESEVELAKSVPVDSEKNKNTIKFIDWEAVGIWATVATITERVEYDQESEPSPYLPLAHYLVIRKDDLIPEKRFNSWLPDLATSSNRNAIEIQAETDEESYVDVESQLTEIASNALVGSNALETRLELKFPCFPLFQLGDWVTVEGRALGLSGNEVVIGIDYDVNESFETAIQCTNVISGVKPGKYLEADL